MSEVKKYPYYPRYTNDLAGSVDYQLMDFKEMGLYNYLLDMSWESPDQCYLTSEYLEKLRKLKRITPKRWTNLVQSVLQKFDWCAVREAWYNEKLLRELGKMKSKSSKNSENGRKGGRPKNPTESERLANGNPTESIPEPDSEPDSEPKKEKSPPRTQRLGDFEDKPLAIFQHWQESMGSPRSKLTDGRRKRIKARLKEGYTVDDCNLAIDGCKASDFHMGHNDRATKYNGVERIFRSGEELEKFAGLNSKVQAKQTQRVISTTWVPCTYCMVDEIPTGKWKDTDKPCRNCKGGLQMRST